MVDLLEKAMADYDAEISTALRRGEMKERIFSIKSMHKFGITVETIANIYSIQIEKVMECLECVNDDLLENSIDDYNINRPKRL